MGNFFCSIICASRRWRCASLIPCPRATRGARRPGPLFSPGTAYYAVAVEERAASTGASWRRTQRVIRRDATGRLPPVRHRRDRIGIKLHRRGVKVARGTASASALSSPSSPAPAVKQPAAPEQLPALRAQPVGHHVERTRCDHHHGQHGTASINQALGRGSRRALRAPSSPPTAPAYLLLPDGRQLVPRALAYGRA